MFTSLVHVGRLTHMIQIEYFTPTLGLCKDPRLTKTKNSFHWFFHILLLSSLSSPIYTL